MHKGYGYKDRHGERRPFRQFILFRLLFMFGFMALVIFISIRVFAFIIDLLFGGGPNSALEWIGGFGLALGVPVLALVMAFRTFMRFTNPIADFMTATESLAQGDLSTRVNVPQGGPGEYRRLGESFNRMAQELERADQQRRNLTADVAHELRTPLHIIQGNLEGIIDGVYKPDADHITATLDETRLLARLIEDLRTLAAAEAGQLSLVIEPVNVRDLFADVQTSFGGEADAKGVTLHVDAGDAPSRISGDATRLNQILNNLVANALRHTSSGGEIYLQARSSSEGLRIIVRDTGEGIAPDDLPYIFDRFWRGDRSRQRSDGIGGGLGLAITRQLVHAHNGRINVESSPGNGTTFTLDFPAG